MFKGISLMWVYVDVTGTYMIASAHTNDVIGPSLVGRPVHVAEGIPSFPIYPHTLTGCNQIVPDWSWGMFHITNHVTKN